MKKIIIVLLLGLSGSEIIYAQVSPIPVPYKGIVTKYNSTIIADDACPDAKNVLFDETGGVSKITGGINYDNSSPVQAEILGEYEYVKSNGYKYMLKVVGSSIQYTSGDGNWTTLISTLSTSYEPDFATFNDEVWITNGYDEVYHFDGSVFISSPSMPRFCFIEVYQNRLWGANITGDLNKIGDSSLSSVGNSSIFSYDYVNKNDGDYITGLIAYNGVLYVFKSKSIHAVIWKYALNLDDDSYIIRQITNEFGTPSDKTIREFNKKIVFFDTKKRNIYEMDATTEGEATITARSIQIANKLKDLTFSYDDVITETTAGDYGAGTSSNIDTMTFSGSIVLDASNNQINQIQQSSSSYVPLYLPSAIIMYQSFMSSCTLKLTTICVSMDLVDVSYSTQSVYIKLLDNNRNSLLSTGIQRVYLNTRNWIPFDVSTMSITITADTVYYIGVVPLESIKVNWRRSTPNDPINPYTRGNPFSYTTPSGAWTETNIYDFAFKVYLKHYTQGQYGYYQSKIHTATNVTAWGIFEPDYNEPVGTNLDWYVSAATATTVCSTDYLTAVTPGQVVNSSNKPYVMFFASMSTTNISVSPKIDDIILNYSKSIPENKIPGIAYKDHYYISVSTQGCDYNGLVYCANKDWVWTCIEGWYPRCFVVYNDNLYCGDSRNTGYTRRLLVDDVYDFWGNDYESYFITKNFHLNQPDSDKIYDKLYLNLANGGISGHVLCQASFDSSDIWVTSKTINLSETTKSIYNKKMSFPLSAGNRGKYIKLKLSNNATNQYWEFHGGNVYYTVTEEQ